MAKSAALGNHLNDVFVINADTIFAVGEYGTLLKTTDGGVSWDVQNLIHDNNVNINQIYHQLFDITFIDDLNGWIVGSVGSNWRTVD